ncbi:MAG: hypothetical protein AAGL96_16985, partial [Pseudomonadota bacterium]
MGPFPHDAPKSQITAENPAGTDGFEFVEFAHPEPDELRALFTRMGYQMVARHKTQQIELWQQGDITYVLNSGCLSNVIVSTRPKAWGESMFYHHEADLCKTQIQS